MKKFDLTGAKLISLLVILPLFLWFTTLKYGRVGDVDVLGASLAII